MASWTRLLKHWFKYDSFVFPGWKMRTSLLTLRVVWTPEKDMGMFQTSMPPRSSRKPFRQQNILGERLLLTRWVATTRKENVQVEMQVAWCLPQPTTVFCIWHTSKTMDTTSAFPVFRSSHRPSTNTEEQEIRKEILSSLTGRRLKRSNFYSCWFMTYPLVKTAMEIWKKYHQNDGVPHCHVSLQECRWCFFWCYPIIKSLPSWKSNMKAKQVPP